MDRWIDRWIDSYLARWESYLHRNSSIVINTLQSGREILNPRQKSTNCGWQSLWQVGGVIIDRDVGYIVAFF